MKLKSLVWHCYDRVLDGNKKTSAVICQLCENRYKFFGNTTNLKVHLEKKHPVQWEQLNNGLLDEAAKQRIASVEETTPKRVYKLEKDDDSVVDSDNDESEDQRASLKLVQQMHGDGSDVEWLEEDPFQTTYTESYTPKKKRPRTMLIKPGLVNQYVKRSSPYVKQTPQVIVKEAPKDDFSIFGEYVANRLRKLKPLRTGANIQQIITTILWQAEYGLYDDIDSVRRILTIPIELKVVDDPSNTQEQMENAHEDSQTVQIKILG